MQIETVCQRKWWKAEIKHGVTQKNPIADHWFTRKRNLRKHPSQGKRAAPKEAPRACWATRSHWLLREGGWGVLKTHTWCGEVEEGYREGNWDYFLCTLGEDAEDEWSDESAWHHKKRKEWLQERTGKTTLQS